MCSICACQLACGVASHDTLAGHDSKSSKKHHGAASDGEDEKDSDDDSLTTGVAENDGDVGDLVYEFDATVPAGEELFKCMYVQVPKNHGVIAVPSVESHYTPGSHHLLVYRSDLTEIPNGETGVWECSDAAWFSHARGSYYEAQQPDEQRELPEGIAHKFQPGEVMILQSHYINITDKDIDAHVNFTLHTMDADDVRVEAGTIYFNDANINIPPHAKAMASMSCPLPQDINLALLWSHMHKRGVHFVVETDDPVAAEKLGSPIYESHDWAEPRAKTYPEGDDVVLHAGTRIKFSCEFQNDTENTYRFGNSAETNEMCILHGMYWPRMPSISEQCVLGRMTARSM
ncbi:MAG TPA: hypothetical protein VJR89_39170 [Polyangiales bacterium]|nr:hypothetical protein [Polyangiales bacterium]